ncbi:MAG: toll/interleukin-1 receptor domain-containing protein, partial [Candidatus Zixiibacteriota bacterium]
VFISYSHKDEEWKDKLVTHLDVLQKQGLLEIWEDRQIAGGDEWYPEIEKAIKSAHVAILMISANFLTSEFILGKEVPELLKRRQKDNLRIMPLIVKPCAWNTRPWLKRLQARPKDGKPLSGGNDFQIDSHLAAFAKEIFDLLRRVPKEPPTTPDHEPFLIPPRKIEISKLPVTSPILFGRETELETLNKAWENPQTKILSSIAWGGVGKSALVNVWLNKMEEHNYKGAELVYGWSFYSQGTKEKGQASADGFFNDAFKWFGYTGDIPKTQHEKGRLLAEIISRERTLLILDGLEPLQYPPGEMHGFLKDKTMAGFLKNLARSMNGLCIITSRCNVEDLQATEGRASLTQNLENLSEQAGMAVLRSYSLKGTDKEFIETSREFKGHALALHLVGSYLKAFCDGDIKQRRFIPKLTQDEKRGGHARRVMESYEKWFAETNKAELDVLYLLGLFDRPAVKEAVDVLKKKPAIKGLTDRLQHLSNRDWQLALNHLRELRLIARKDDHNPDTLDCHPLIREHFGEKLQQQSTTAWKQAHVRLYEYYKNLPEKNQPDTLEEMEPLFAAVMHGCLAGKHQEALDDVYWKRIRRQQQAYTVHKLGAFGADLSCLSSFFETLWDKPASGLTEADKVVILSWAGFRLRAVGRLSEAARPMKAALEVSKKDKDWKGTATDADNLSRLYLTLGDVATAHEYGAQGATFADRSGEWEEKMMNRTTHADALHQAGENKAAEELFVEAENMQKKSQSGYPYLYSLRGFQYCDLLLSMGKCPEVLERARTTLKQMQNDPKAPLLTVAVDKLTIGKASMLQAIETDSSDFTVAEDYLTQAVDGLRESGEQDELPRGLFARATLFRHQKDFPKSWTDLDEAREIAEYGQMRLHLTDYHLGACRNIREQLTVRQKDGGSPTSSYQPTAKGYQIIEDGEDLSLTKEEMQTRFKEHFKEAERLINETGYHRRDGELEELSS